MSVNLHSVKLIKARFSNGLKILTLYSKGLSVREIAEEVGLNKSAVHKRLENT